jgi:hypothetical protein
MAKFSTKHRDRQNTFSFKSFTDGLNTDISALLLPETALSECSNMRYYIEKGADGVSRVILKKRQGTTKISATALPAAADVMACTYFVAHSTYILATQTKLYYLDGSLLPVEIGTDALSGVAVPTFTEFKGKLIIHDGGVTKALDGSPPTIETLTSLVDDEIIGTGNNSTVDFTGTLGHPAVGSATLVITYTDGTAKTITCNAAGTLAGDVASHELMPNQVDRDFSGASAWTNVDLNAYDETTDLTITASAVGQYCTCPVLSAPTTSGSRYRMTFSVANLVGTWTVKSFDGTKTIGTVSVTGAQSFDWTATTTGGYRIVSVATNSSGDFDNFTLTTNVMDHTTGVYTFRASGAPDNTTSIYANYEKAAGAPKSTAGLVRASRLYMWGDADNLSRLWYSGPNDEDAWADSTSGGYLDVDPLDGYSLLGCLNFFESLILIKGNSLHRLESFPGDTVFRVVPLMPDLGTVATKTCMNDGEMVSFLSKEGLVGMSATQLFGDIQKSSDLSEKFRKIAVRYANNSAYSEYNQLDKQIWLAMYDGSSYLSDIYVLNFATGGQLGLYRFAFGHSCFKYVNGMMLIGGVDGNLYKLVDDTSTFLDNGVSYKTTTYFRSNYTNFNLPFNRKHNKRIMFRLYGKGGVDATMELYKNQQYAAFSSGIIPFEAAVGELKINPDGLNYFIFDMGFTIAVGEAALIQTNKFNYRELMFKIKDIEGVYGAEFFGVDFIAAVIGG